MKKLSHSDKATAAYHAVINAYDNPLTSRKRNRVRGHSPNKTK